MVNKFRNIFFFLEYKNAILVTPKLYFEITTVITLAAPGTKLYRERWNKIYFFLNNSKFLPKRTENTTKLIGESLYLFHYLYVVT